MLGWDVGLKQMMQQSWSLLYNIFLTVIWSNPFHIINHQSFPYDKTNPWETKKTLNPQQPWALAQRSPYPGQFFCRHIGSDGGHAPCPIGKYWDLEDHEESRYLWTASFKSKCSWGISYLLTVLVLLFYLLLAVFFFSSSSSHIAITLSNDPPGLTRVT